MKLTLSARPPFSFPSVVKSHGWVQLVPFGFDPDATLLTYVDRLDSGRVVELRLRPVSDGVSVEVDGALPTCSCCSDATTS